MLVAQSCWSCGLQANTRNTTLKQKWFSYAKNYFFYKYLFDLFPGRGLVQKGIRACKFTSANSKSLEDCAWSSTYFTQNTSIWNRRSSCSATWRFSFPSTPSPYRLASSMGIIFRWYFTLRYTIVSSNTLMAVLGPGSLTLGGMSVGGGSWTGCDMVMQYS